MLTVVATSFQDIHEEAEGCDITLPIEQTETWARYQDTIDGRRFWNALMIMDGGGRAGGHAFSDRIQDAWLPVSTIHARSGLDGSA